MATLSLSEVQELFIYDPATGLVRWRKTLSNRARAGTVAGKVRKRYGRQRGTPYIVVRARGRYMLAHRIAFLLMTGTVPALIDHRDTDGINNRWLNLRTSTDTQNRANTHARRHLKGAYKRPGRDKWMARLTVNKKRLALGDYNTELEAHEAYCRAAEQHFGEFARYA